VEGIEEWGFRAVKGFIILKISLEMGEMYCVWFSDVR
jgi:hypothetical protein